MKSLTPIILIAISLGLYFWQVSPNYADVKELRAESAQYDQALQVADDLQKLRSELQKTLDSLPKEDLARLEVFMPDHLDSVRLILDVTGIANKFGIALKDTKVNTGASSGNSTASSKTYSVASISFSFNTSYTNAVDFMKEIEKSLRLADVVSVGIKPSADPKKSGGYDFGMTLNTYWVNKTSK